MAAHALIRHAGSGRWFAYSKPAAVLTATRTAHVPDVVDEAERLARREGLHAVGFLSYEAAPGLEPKLTTHAPGLLPPAWFALFPEPRAAADPTGPAPPPLHWQPSLAATDYRRTVARIRDYIAAGDTYQVNFSYRLRAVLPGTGADLREIGPDPCGSLFRYMISRQPAGLGAYIETDAWAVCCASHELFFARRGRRITSRPMKGTAPRGATETEDAQHAQWLRSSLKNRAENLMITDMVRNDLGRLARVGTMCTESLFQLEAYPTLWQMTSTVHGETDASLAGILRALFPAASITGAPKRRTMEIIRELESEPREIYTGTVGVIQPSGDAQFNVAIRTALVDKLSQRAEYGVGGAILWDSDPAEEHRETLTKARILAPADPPEFSLLETLLWEPEGGFWLLEGHLARLDRSARHLFHRRPDGHGIRRRLEALARGLPRQPHRVRLLLDGHLELHLEAARLSSADRPRRVALARDPAPVLDNPFVAHKTTRRDLYDAARCQAAAMQADDLLLINERGEVTESTIANLVVDLDGTLVTPPLRSGLLPGVFRQHLLDTGRVVEGVVRREDLARARAVYLANSVRGLWGVEVVATV